MLSQSSQRQHFFPQLSLSHIKHSCHRLLARSAFRADLTRTEAHVIPLSNVSDTVAVTGSGKGCDVESGVHIVRHLSFAQCLPNLISLFLFGQSTSVMRWDSDKEAMGRPDSDKDSSKMYE